MPQLPVGLSPCGMSSDLSTSTKAPSCALNRGSCESEYSTISESVYCDSKITPEVYPRSGRYLNAVKVSIRLPWPYRLRRNKLIIWQLTFSSSGETRESAGTAYFRSSEGVLLQGPTVCGRIPPHPTRPYEGGYELSETGCGYRRRERCPRYSLDLGLPGEYRVSCWIEGSQSACIRTFEVFRDH